MDGMGSVSKKRNQESLSQDSGTEWQCRPFIDLLPLLAPLLRRVFGVSGRIDGNQVSALLRQPD